MNDHRHLARLLREAADKVEAMPENHAVHTVTVTLWATAPSGVQGTVEFDVLHPDYMEDGEPITLH